MTLFADQIDYIYDTASATFTVTRDNVMAVLFTCQNSICASPERVNNLDIPYADFVKLHRDINGDGETGFIQGVEKKFAPLETTLLRPRKFEVEISTTKIKLSGNINSYLYKTEWYPASGIVRLFPRLALSLPWTDFRDVFIASHTELIAAIQRW